MLRFPNSLIGCPGTGTLNGPLQYRWGVTASKPREADRLNEHHEDPERDEEHDRRVEARRGGVRQERHLRAARGAPRLKGWERSRGRSVGSPSRHRPERVDEEDRDRGEEDHDHDEARPRGRVEHNPHRHEEETEDRER